MKIDDIAADWNEQADKFNQWDDLDCDKKLKFVVNYFTKPRPPETAPRDGKDIIGFFGNGLRISSRVISYVQYGSVGRWDGGGTSSAISELKGWLPLPGVSDD